jgi:Ca2+-transporting ATPase
MATTVNWHSQSSEKALERLGVAPSTGLSAEEAQRRLEAYGRNELREQPRPGFLQRLLNQFRSMVVLLLIAASIVSAALGELYEAGAIILIVILNAILGVVQEGRAEQALAALKKLSAPEARVLRETHVVTIPEAEVVPGDIVLLEAGNYIPADVRLIQSANLKIDEASLTGESVPVNKYADVEIAEDAVLGDRKTMGYKSTIATYGRGEAVVVATGMETEIGKIAEMIQSVEEEETPLQKRLDQLGRWLVYGSLGICGLIFAIGFGRAWLNPGELTLGEAALDSFLTAIALAIAAVPEGLPAVVTINLAMGMREMIARNALIRRLPAVETLGSASAICSDKTGTLTQNEMTAVKLYVMDSLIDVTGEGYRPHGSFHQDGERIDPGALPDVGLLLTGALAASDARLEKIDSANGDDHTYRIVGDPTEGALVVAAAKANLTHERIAMLYPRQDEIPFDSARKRMSTLHNDPDTGNYIFFVKGAPDFVLELCTRVYRQGREEPLNDEMRSHLLNVNRDMAQGALRVLAVAYRHFDTRPDELTVDEHEQNLVFVGLVGMIDPARPEVRPAVQKAREAGIKTVMVTGDYAETARAIAGEIGLLREGGRVVAGPELAQMSDEDLAQAIDEVDVFARVSPEHKVRIVDAFRRRNYVVAMTGDGVNDAPALKRASIGVAMGITGTDVSKETADMVLTDDNYASIVSAVEQGRIIYSNIRKFVYFLLSCNLAEIMVIFLATLFGWASPLTPIQLLWLNLLTDGAPAIALGFEKGDPDIMARPPRPPEEPIIDRIMRIGMVVQTIAITSATLLAYWFGLRHGADFMAANPALAAETAARYGPHAHYPVLLAQTMAFVTLSTSELLRAYTSRSEYFSIFRIGPLSNKTMQIAVVASMALLVAVVYVPFLQPVFNTLPLGLVEIEVFLPLVFLPSVAAELTKWAMRLAGLHKAPALVAAKD